MTNSHSKPDYKSPKHKLIRFFEKSRDQWKAKAQAAKTTIKRLTNRISALEKSRQNWKTKAKTFERELSMVKRQHSDLQKEIDTLKKNVIDAENAPYYPEEFTYAPGYHQYSVGHINLYLSLVLSAATSLRGASNAIEVMLSAIKWPLATPSWVTGRNWLLRLGYYKLMRAKEKAEDWIWIIDHTVQTGPEKCLLILGVRASALEPADMTLSQHQVEPIALYPVTQSNGEVVFQQLNEVVDKTGVPKAIVSDHGSDLKSGIDQFCQSHPKTVHIYDIKHKTALVLKHELAENEDWKRFCQLSSQTKQRLQQTQWSFLAPPNQKQKARYMNVDRLVKWGQEKLTYLDDHFQTPETDQDHPVIEKLGWLREFRSELTTWGEILDVTITTEQLIRKEGLYRGCHKKLKKKLIPLAHTQQAKQVMQTLQSFVTEESFKVKANERILASSEIIESTFGKLKHLEKDQSKNSFTGLLLGVAALVSTTTSDVIKAALESTPTKKVIQWCQDNLGNSLPPKKQETHTEKREQKSDQIKEVA